MEKILNDLIEKITKTLGFGHKESVYENTLVIELRKLNYEINRQYNIDIIYENSIVGNVRLDLVVEKNIVIEMKALSAITKKEINQIKRYKALGNFTEAFLINISSESFEINNIA